MKTMGIMARWAGTLALVLGAILVTDGSALAADESAISEAAKLRREAIELSAKARYSEAIVLARKALAITEETLGPTHVDVAESLSILAGPLRTQGNYADARLLYERALAIREQALGSTHPLVGETLNDVAGVRRAMGDYASARPLYERALEIREQALGPADPGVADSLNSLAGLLRTLGDYTRARSLYERALAIREQALGPTHPRVAESLNSLASLLRTVGDYPTARPLYERALTIREQTFGSEHPEVASSVNNLARLLELMGDYAGARPLYERALKIRERAFGKTNIRVATSLNDLAGLLKRVGDYAEARRLYDRALAIRERELGPVHPAVASSLNDLGRLLRAMGDYGGARPLFERALAIREQALGPMSPDVAQSLNDLGGLLRATGDVAVARGLYERALTIREQVFGPNHPDVAQSLTTIAVLFESSGDAEAARPLFERALAIRERALGPTHPRVASSLANLASLLAAGGDYSSARHLFVRSLAISQGAPTLGTRWRAVLGLGRIEEHDGRLDAALPLYREAVTLVTQLSAQLGEEARSRYLDVGNKIAAYDALVNLLLRLHRQDPTKGYDREGWAVLETKRGWVAAEGSASGGRPQDRRGREVAGPVLAKQDQVTALESQIREEEAKPADRQIPDRIQNLTRLLARTKAEYNTESAALESRIRGDKEREKEYQGLVAKGMVPPKDLASFARFLPAGTLAVEYYSTPETLYTFLVGPGVYEIRESPIAQAELYGLIWKYRRLTELGTSLPTLPWEDDGSEVYRKDVAPFKALVRRLGQLLLDPLHEVLEKHPDVVLFPNDLLTYLPIHALTWLGPDTQERFLAETHRVTYATQHEFAHVISGGVGGPSSSVVVVGNPDGSLLASSAEVRAVGRLRTGAVVLEGASATKERLLAELARQNGEFDLHLATHGVLDGPGRSYLVLAGRDEGSRRLTLEEVAGKGLSISLAVLSACDTALPGEIAPGVALITMANAFSRAGARAVVAALWQVEEEATRDWMVALHRALAAGGSRAAAVQEAQRAVRSRVRTAHPYYWAGFVLIGAR